MNGEKKTVRMNVTLYAHGGVQVAQLMFEGSVGEILANHPVRGLGFGSEEEGEAAGRLCSCLMHRANPAIDGIGEIHG